MLCDLCNERAVRILRVNQWRVCQWCVTHQVLDHALKVEEHIKQLRGAVVAAGEKHGADIRAEGAATTNMEHAFAAYSALSNAMDELNTSKRRSMESSRIAISAKKALKNYAEDEQRKTRKARHHA